jgi:hypothetical protein
MALRSTPFTLNLIEPSALFAGATVVGATAGFGASPVFGLSPNALR